MNQNNIDPKQALAALAAHGFDTEYFDNREQATAWLLEQVAPGASVGMGGSLTLQQLGLADRLREQGAEVLWHWDPNQSNAEKREIFHRCMQADMYFCSANALTEDGCILNVDGNGNRVASTIFGPQRVYVVAGINKLVPDVAAAFARVETIAPLNCRRQGRNTSCAETGICCNCSGEDRSCRVYVLSKHRPRLTPTTVVLIGEELGL